MQSLFNFILDVKRRFYSDYGILASFVLINIVMGTFGLIIFFSRILVPVADIREQVSTLQKSRFYTARVAKFCWIWPSLLRVPAMFKVLFMKKNWWRLLLVVLFTLTLAVPIYYWPLKCGSILYISDETWFHIQYMCRPLSPVIHLCVNSTLVRCVGKRTISMELGLTVMVFTCTFLQFCLIIIGFQ